MTQPLVDDIPTFGSTPEPAEPIPFRLAYTDAKGRPQEELFTARGAVPYAWVMEFWDAQRLNIAGQSSALLTFLRRCLTDDDHDRFFERINDPKLSAEKETLQQIATYLLMSYEQVGPTTARSGGQGRSRSGRSSSGSGSRASRPAKAPPRSKSSTRASAPR